MLGAVVVAALGSGLTTACDVRPVRTFVVTTTADEADAVPGDGTCATASGSGCSLRAAIEEAGASGGLLTNEIVLAGSSSYTVDRTAAGVDTPQAGDLDTFVNIRIEGHGATISGGQVNRVFEVHAGRLHLDQLTVRDGRADVGAGVRNHAQLTATRVRFSGNASSGAGGTAIHQDDGSTHLFEVTVEGNPSIAPAGTPTGAVEVIAGGLAIQRSTIADNHGFSCDEVVPIGLWCRDDSTTPTTATTLAAAAGVYNAGGTVLVSLSTISHNRGNVRTLFCVNVPRPGCVGTVLATVRGDGIVAAGGRTVVVRSTLLGDERDVAGSGDVEAGGSVVASCEHLVETLGYNLDGDGSCVDGTDPTDVAAGPFAIDEDLADNGGPTRTHLPFLPPIIDAIPAGMPVLCDASVPVDQRGLPSATNGACDRGSVER